MFCFFFFFFNDTATTEIYTLSLHDALPIYRLGIAPVPKDAIGADQVVEQRASAMGQRLSATLMQQREVALAEDRKSTRLNSSHGYISYAVFCLKKKKNTNK